jgi:hypothetical protein
MNGNKKICRFFQQGTCRNGQGCNFSHEMDSQSNVGSKMFSNQMREISDGLRPNTTNTSMTINPQDTTTNNSNKICNYFLKGTCTKTVCKFFHGYAENLQNVKIEKIHEKNIISMCQISETKFLTADPNLIQIWLITETEHKSIGSQPFEEKITKVIYSNEKVIVSTQIEQMYARFISSLGDDTLFDSINFIFFIF